MNSTADPPFAGMPVVSALQVLIDLRQDDQIVVTNQASARIWPRLARASTSPDDFQGAHSVLGSASHSGFGSEPAIVVGNSMGLSPRVS